MTDLALDARRGARPAVADALRVAIALAGDLGRGHRAGRVHGAVTRDRIVLGPGGAVTLLPATAVVESDKTPSIVTSLALELVPVGTDGAPERARGGPVDARTDVFALGVILHELLAGQRPARRDGAGAALVGHGLGVPPALAAVVERCLAADPDDRFADGLALADALGAVVLPSRRASASALVLDTLDGLTKVARGGAALAGQPDRAITAEPHEERTPMSATGTNGTADAAAQEEPPVELRDGDTLGDFRIVRRLGAGAMGVVYEAVEQQLRRTVALKVLPDELTRDPKRRARFLREARAAAAVTDPAVVAIYQIGAADGRDYIAMELVRGQTLRAALADGPLPIARAVRLARAIAQGLGRAHEAGVIHRDVKPDNVMLTADGDVKILDFGIARLTDPESDKNDAASDKAPAAHTALTGEGHLIGTPGYMAPEQSRGAPIDARADVFALGAMLYEMLTGLRPFRGTTPLEVIIASARDDVPPLHGVRADVPPALAAVADRCLAKDPDARFANGRAVADALGAIALPAGRDAAVALMLDTLDAPAPRGPGTAPVTAPGPAAPRSEAPLATPAPAPRAGRARLGLALLALAALGAAVVILATAGGDAPPPAAMPSVATSPPTAAPTPPSAAAEPAAPATPTPAPPAAAAAAPPTSAAAPKAGPLVRADDDAVVPCVIFEATGDEDAGGWLGAAAADLACIRLSVHLGLGLERTRVPAELLGMPRAPADDLPLDPYSAPGARERSIAAARAVGPLWLDGRVTLGPTSFTVEVHLGPDASGRGEGSTLHAAVAHAVDALVASGAVAPAKTLAPALAGYVGTEDVAAELAHCVVEDAQTTGVGLADALAALAQHEEQLLPQFVAQLRQTERELRDEAAAAPARAPSAPAEAPVTAPVDDTTPARAYQTNIMRGALHLAEGRALADELAALRPRITDPDALALVERTEAGYRLFDGDAEGARALILRAQERSPRLVDPLILSWGAYGTAWADAASRTATIWAPAHPDGWYRLAETLPDATPEARLPFARRAMLLGPGTTTFAMELASKLVLAGKPVAARAIAARLADGEPDQQLTSQAIAVMVDISEGAFGRAFERAFDTLMRLDRVGRLAHSADVELLSDVQALGRVLGRGPKLCDAVAERFVLADPPRLTTEPGIASAMGAVCAEASRDVAKRCFARIRALMKDGYFSVGHVAVLDAAFDLYERFGLGDMKGAAAAARPLLASGGRNSFAVRAFDAIGEYDTASTLDKLSFGEAPQWHGAVLGHAREARRATLRGDVTTARALARQVIDAWSVADVTVPTVAEMRALLAKLPPEPAAAAPK